MDSRRSFLQVAAAAVASLGGVSRLFGIDTPPPGGPRSTRPKPTEHSVPVLPRPVITPDVKDLPFTLDNDIKVFRLVAEAVKRKIAPWKTIDCWGFNGSCPGPTIQVNQGDHIRIVVENRLPESFAIHWHGLEIPYAMDGMPYLSQKPIAPGSVLAYEFTVHQNGTFFYHSHSPMQQMMGMIGMFILHPPRAHAPIVDHDFGIVLQEWALLPNNTVPNTANMEWNWLTFNGICSPMTTPLVVRLGSRVRVRLVNLGMDHHPIHLHGHTFVVTGTEAGRQPETLWGPANTVLVGVAQARDFEFVANNPGEWMLHCHMPHHNMNAMSDLLGDRMMMTADTEDSRALIQMQTLADQVGFQHVHHAPITPDANNVPGFPQDAFMDMGMDEVVAKPENNGLPRNWSAMMMGMMTLLRVLPPDLYDLVMKDVKNGYTAPPPPLGGHEHGEHQHGDHDHRAHDHSPHANDEGHPR
jgi:FtsP/CotA-like multicopper oxidase with cupredoxin domain